jgi:TRAP-type mannitol/chloroaromatic compound transport system permease large subunit
MSITIPLIYLIIVILGSVIVGIAIGERKKESSK